jgi:amino acid transporter
VVLTPPSWRTAERSDEAFAAYSECMRIAIGVLGVIVALFGLLWALQGFGVVGGSPMSNTTTWSIIGPIVALIGIALAFAGFRGRKP